MVDTSAACSTVDEVVAVEVTVDAMLVLADLCHLADVPVTLGIRTDTADPQIRDLVTAQVRRDLTAQGVLGSQGHPHPSVAQMLDTLSGAERTLAGRWWRRTLRQLSARTAENLQRALDGLLEFLPARTWNEYAPG